MKLVAPRLLRKRRIGLGSLLSVNVCRACLDWRGKGASGQASALLGAPEARSSLPERAFAEPALVFVERTKAGAARQAVPGGGDFCGDEKRKPGVGARSALRQLTRRRCLSAVSAANEASSATRPQAEHRSAVCAQRRPPRHEPQPGTACRAALKPRKSERTRTAATGRGRRLASRGGRRLQPATTARSVNRERGTLGSPSEAAYSCSTGTNGVSNHDLMRSQGVESGSSFRIISLSPSLLSHCRPEPFGASRTR